MAWLTVMMFTVTELGRAAPPQGSSIPVAEPGVDKAAAQPLQLSQFSLPPELGGVEARIAPAVQNSESNRTKQSYKK